MAVKSLRLLITDGCSLSCKYCHGEGMVKKNGKNKTVMDLDVVSNLLDYSKDKGGLKIQITGGEPFEHPEIDRIVELLNQRKDCYGDLVFTTNGTETQKIGNAVKAFAKNRKARFNITCQAVNEDDYVSIVNLKNEDSAKKKYASLMQTLDMFSQSQFRVKINVPLTKSYALNNLEKYIRECYSRSFELRFIELFGSDGSKRLSFTASSNNKFVGEQHVTVEDFKERMRLLGYRSKQIGSQRVSVYKSELENTPEVSLVHCCPQICSNCSQEVSCLRITPQGELASCFYDLNRTNEPNSLKSIAGTDEETTRIHLEEADQKIKLQVSGSLKNSLISDNHSEIILFVSFDITNSSKLKERNPKLWQFALFQILEQTKGRLVNQKLFLWRVIGDELVFYYQLRKGDNVEDNLNIIYEVLDSMNEELRDDSFNWKYFPNSGRADAYVELGLSATAWLAPVFFPLNSRFFNEAEFDLAYIFSMHDDFRYGLYNLEFLGSDLDIGFGISKEGERNDLIISYEAAQLFLKQQGDKKRLKLSKTIQFEKIWDKQDYPIISYLRDSGNEDPEVLKCLSEIEARRSDLKNKIHYIEHTIERTENPSNLLQPLKPYDVHLVAVCYRENGSENPEILMLKRDDENSKESKRNKWDFGYCKFDDAKHQKDTSSLTIAGVLMDQYAEQYDIAIEICDPRPLMVYSDDDKEYETVIGIRFLAKVIDDSEIDFEKRLNLESEYGKKYQYAEYVNYETYSERMMEGDKNFIDKEQVKQVFEDYLNPQSGLLLPKAYQ